MTPRLQPAILRRRVLRRSAVVAVTCLTFVGCVHPHVLGAQTTTCLSADSTSANVLQYVRDLVTIPTVERASMRSALSLASSSNASQIVLVTDQKVCNKLVPPINAMLQTPGASRTLYVIKISDGFAVLDPAQPAGEYKPLMFFTRQYVYKSAVNAF
jgi:hypothetical protein